MTPETTTTETKTEKPATGNISLAQLGERMTKGRKASSTPKPAKSADDETATPPASSEQADDGEAKPDLSKLETDDSPALADAKAEGEAETTQETEAEPEPPKAVRDLQKRVGKLTEQRNELREQLAELKTELETLKAGQAQQAAQPAPSHPADSAPDRTIQEIDTALLGVENFLAWADQNPHGGSFEEDGKRFELSAEEVTRYRRQSTAQQSRLNARREARLESMRADFDAKRQAAHNEAVRLYPWVEQKNSPEFQDAIAVIRENPGVLQRPDFELVIARQVVGMRLEKEATKRAGKPGAKPSRPVTPVVTFSPSAAPKSDTTAKTATVSAAENQFKEGGGRFSDLSKLLAAKRQARIEAAKA